MIAVSFHGFCMRCLCATGHSLMQLSLLRSGESLRGDHNAVAPADSEIGPAARASSIVPVVLRPSNPGTRFKQNAACRPILPRTPLRAIGLVVLIWLLSLGQASTAGNVAPQKEVPAPRGLYQAASTLRVVADAHVCADRQQNSSIHLSDGYLFSFSNEMAWDDDDNGETAHPIAWLEARNRSSIVPALGSAPAWIASLASPLLMPARLRC